jgi:MGT family glycosyltransferase
MARFLVTCWPDAGHVNPQLSIAAELQARGHQVGFYTGSSATALLSAERFTTFPFVHNRDEQVRPRVYDAIRRRRDIFWLPRLMARTYREWLVGTIPGQVEDLVPIVRTWQPDVVMTDTIMWGPVVVLREACNVPVAMTSNTIGCWVPGPQARPWIRACPRPLARPIWQACEQVRALALAGQLKRINQLRASFGLPSMDLSISSAVAQLPLQTVPSVPELDFNRTDIPSSVHYVGACVWTKPSGEKPPDYLDSLAAKDRVVHVTEGSAHFEQPFLLKAAAEALGNQPVQVIMASGRQRNPADLGLASVAPNVRVEQWVSYEHLLPKCSVVVTTGGAGTVMATLQAGVPLVVVPTMWDKTDNALRVVHAGVGLHLDPRDCTPATLRAAVNRILDEPSFRRNAQELARKLAEAGGPSRAADLLEQLAARRAAGECRRD